MYFKLLLTFILVINSAIAAETCSRIAQINYQEVLVDAGADKKGEGLRFYLEKDPVSKELLDKYQEENRPTILNASVSTLGSIMLFAGVLQTNEATGIQNQNSLIFGGLFLIGLNYLTSKTIKYNNEKILERSVEEYNKRNKPRIYFSPFSEDNGASGVSFGYQQEF